MRTLWSSPRSGSVTTTSTRTEAGRRAFLGTSALLFVASAGGTVYWCASMSGGMPMAGGWTMSMAWMRMPEQTWPGAAAAFMGMWILMMVAMMLPSLVPMLLGYRGSVYRSGEARLGARTALVGAGYFAVWAVFGAAVYPVGIALGAAEMRWPTLARSVPLATGLILLLAGGVQLTSWKARHLGHCRDACGCVPALPPDAQSAWWHGLRLGRHCSLCCSGFILILLVTGVMDLWIMAAVAGAITAERLAPWPDHVARVAGGIVIMVAVLVIARSLGAIQS
jgi:predicted metal-binding membrane protein